MRTFLAVALLVSGAAAAAPAAAADPLLIVQGSRSGYVDVAMPAFGIDARGYADLRKGRFGGFYAERLGQPSGEEERDAFGVIRITQADEVATTLVEKGSDPGDGPPVYAAGTYRFHVLADGAFRLTLPLTGVTRNVTVAPRRFGSRPRLHVVKGTSTGNTTWEASEEFAVGGVRTAAVSVSFVRWDKVGAHWEVLCFAKPGAECDPDKTQPVSGQAGGGLTGSSRGTGSLFAAPGTLAKGTWVARQRTLTAPGALFTSMVGMALVFDAP